MSEKSDIRERIELTRAMIDTVGWQLMLRDWKDDVKALERQIVLNSKTYDEIQFLRGALSVLHRLVNLADGLDTAEANLDVESAAVEG